MWLWKCFWDWLAALPPGSASFVGTLTGSFLGLVALLLGALFNAHLNRKRDDRLREDDRIALAQAIHAELSGLHRSFVENAQHLTENPPVEGGGFVVPCPTDRIFPEMLPTIGLLRSETIKAVMGAYILTEQYHYKLILLGGKLQPDMPEGQQLVYVGSEHAKIVIELNNVTAGVVKVGIDALAPYLR
jgi:hypothetical protein